MKYMKFYVLGILCLCLPGCDALDELADLGNDDDSGIELTSSVALESPASNWWARYFKTMVQDIDSDISDDDFEELKGVRTNQSVVLTLTEKVGSDVESIHYRVLTQSRYENDLENPYIEAASGVQISNLDFEHTVEYFSRDSDGDASATDIVLIQKDTLIAANSFSVNSVENESDSSFAISYSVTTGEEEMTAVLTCYTQGQSDTDVTFSSSAFGVYTGTKTFSSVEPSFYKLRVTDFAGNELTKYYDSVGAAATESAVTAFIASNQQSNTNPSTDTTAPVATLTSSVPLETSGSSSWARFFRTMVADIDSEITDAEFAALKGVYTNQNVVLTLTAEDAGSEVENVFYRVLTMSRYQVDLANEFVRADSGVQIRDLGFEHTVEYYAVDTEGNRSETELVLVQKDTLISASDFSVTVREDSDNSEWDLDFSVRTLEDMETATLTCYRYGQSDVVVSLAYANFNHTGSQTVSGIQPRYYKLNLEDAAGNTLVKYYDIDGAEVESAEVDTYTTDGPFSIVRAEIPSTTSWNYSYSMDTFGLSDSVSIVAYLEAGNSVTINLTDGNNDGVFTAGYTYTFPELEYLVPSYYKLTVTDSDGDVTVTYLDFNSNVVAQSVVDAFFAPSISPEVTLSSTIPLEDPVDQTWARFFRQMVFDIDSDMTQSAFEALTGVSNAASVALTLTATDQDVEIYYRILTMSRYQNDLDNSFVRATSGAAITGFYFEHTFEYYTVDSDGNQSTTEIVLVEKSFL